MQDRNGRKEYMMKEFDLDHAYKVLSPHFQQRIQKQEPLANHNSFGTGGSADLWLTLETREELAKVVQLCTKEKWPLLVVGAGSNILYADTGVRGIVAEVVLSSYDIEPLSEQEALVVADAGVRWERLLKHTASLGWGGLEFGVGIPGTLGGGIVSNAGSHTQSLGDVLSWIEVLDARGCNLKAAGEDAVASMRRYQHEELALGYRTSRFRQQRRATIDAEGHLTLIPRGLIEPAEIVARLGLTLQRQDPAVLSSLIERERQTRQQAEPEQRHIGSVFIDPPGKRADELIAQAGLRGVSYGKAQISPKNANYIVNLGGATSSDILALIVKAHHQVLLHCGVQLELYLELLGEWHTQQFQAVPIEVSYATAPISTEPHIQH